MRGRPFRQRVRSLDLSWPTQVSRVWAFGSCPYLFERRADGGLGFVRELFTNAPGRLTAETHCLSPDATGLLIAELQPEITELISITVDEVHLARHSILRAGDYLEIELPFPSSIVTITGRYLASRGTRPPSPSSSNDLVAAFLAG